MTREEAIKELKEFKNKSWDGMPEEVIDMTIEALESKTYIIQMSARGAGRSYFYERMKELHEGN